MWFFAFSAFSASIIFNIRFKQFFYVFFFVKFLLFLRTRCVNNLFTPPALNFIRCLFVLCGLLWAFNYEELVCVINFAGPGCKTNQRTNYGFQIVGEPFSLLSSIEKCLIFSCFFLFCLRWVLIKIQSACGNLKELNIKKAKCLIL